MYNPEEALELQQIAKTLHDMVNEFEEKHGIDDFNEEGNPLESFHAIIDCFDQLATDYMNSFSDKEKDAIRKQAFSQLKDLENL